MFWCHPQSDNDLCPAEIHFGSSRDINRVVGDEVLLCESAMDMIGFFIADMVTLSISYTFETKVLGTCGLQKVMPAQKRIPIERVW